MESSNSHRQGPHQSEHKLHEVGDHNGPEPTGHGVSQHQHGDEGQQTNRVGQSEQHRFARHQAQGFHHLAQRQKGIADADAVHGKRQQEGLDAPQPGRRPTAVTQLGKRRISQNPAAPPKGGEDNGHRHMGQAEAPPLPVTSQAATADQPGHVEGGVDRERGGRHRCAGQPAAQATPGNEVVLFTPIATGQPKAKHQGAHQIQTKKGPVDRCHARSSPMTSLKAFSGGNQGWHSPS